MYELLEEVEEIIEKAINTLRGADFDKFKEKLIKRLEEIE